MEEQKPHISSALDSQRTPSTNTYSEFRPMRLMLLGILFILVLSALGISSYLLASHSKITPLSSKSTATTPTPTPTPNPTANWQTYTDPSQRFSFQYPSEYQPVIITHSNNIVLTTATIAAQIKAKFGSSGACFPYYPIQVSQINEVNGYGITNSYQTTTTSQVTIDGTKATAYTIDYKQTPPCSFMTGHEINIIVQKAGKIYLVQLSNSDNVQYKQIFDLFLKTLHFPTMQTTLSPTPTPILSKTYTDNLLGYSITYPPMWIVRKTYGPDIQKQAPSDIVSGFDLTYNLTSNGQTNTQATIVVNVLDRHNASDIQSWISQYDLNYPKNATKTNTVFRTYPAILYNNFTESTHPTEYLYFLSGNYAYRIAYWEQAGISQTTRQIVNSFIP